MLSALKSVFTIGSTRSICSGNFDLVIVGGGIVGLACAHEITTRYPFLHVALLEKENRLAIHQSNHNAGVIHEGINYKPNSDNAQLCMNGNQLTYDYCCKKGISYSKCGKLIVATNAQEESWLDDLYSQGDKCKIPALQMLNSEELRLFAPFCAGTKAIWCPSSGVVNWREFAQSLAVDFQRTGQIFLNFTVTKFSETKSVTGDALEFPVTILGASSANEVRARYVLTCGGLQSDFLAELTGCDRSPRVVPFRGEYLMLCKSKSYLVRSHIYAATNPEDPFWGIHFTPCIDGSVILGPYAVMAFAREGYIRGDWNFKELLDAISYPGLPKMLLKHLNFGMLETLKSMSSTLQLQDFQKIFPCLRKEDILPGPSGVRAQAIDMDGNLIDKFVVDRGTGRGVVSSNVLHVRSVPSPGATNCLSFAKVIADILEVQYNISNLATGRKS